MLIYRHQLIIIHLAAAVLAVASGRTPRHIVQQVPVESNVLPQEDYPLCSVGDVTAACLSPSECANTKGRYAGQCDIPGLVCCYVEKSCNGDTSAHSVTFRNPSYPKTDDAAALCPLTLRTGRNVCAVRVDLSVFELAAYEDDTCLRDTLTIIGGVEGIATPICGNMTGFETTFEVKELSTVILALVAQGTHRFSITVTQLDCSDVPFFISPTYAGIRNDDAETYTPTSTPASKDKKKPGIAWLKDDEGNEDTTTQATAADSEEEEGDDEKKTTTTEKPKETSDQDGMEENIAMTTIKRGKWPGTTTTPLPVEFEVYKSNSEGDVAFQETIDPVPTISVFREEFQERLRRWPRLPEEEKEAGEELLEEEVFEPTFRIIGGFKANINEYPWQVALAYKKKFFCGASLISDRHVLTAAHCVFGAFEKGIHLLLASLGDHDLRTKNETRNVAVGIKKVIWNLNYSPHININDIAIMELAEPVNFTYGIAAVKLPLDVEDDFTGRNATVTGWGRFDIKKRQNVSPILKEYTGELVNSTVCQNKWEKFPTVKALADRHICLNVTTGSPCHGDSGGPLVVCNGPQCTQVGVVSFGFPLCTNVGMPAVFSSTVYYRPWLNRNLAPLRIRPVQG